VSLFAKYRPARPPDARPAVGLRIREWEPADRDAILALIVERGDPARNPEGITAELSDPGERSRLFVACLEERVVAFARAGWLERGTIPDGWYLTGVIVSAAHRRRGIGRALTEHRIRWLARRTDVVHYFVNARNRASIDLHSSLGFEEIDRNITVPGVTFAGGVGLLFELRLR